MIHGRLFPLYPIRHDLQLQLSLQAYQCFFDITSAIFRIAGSPAILYQSSSDAEQSPALQDSPVAFVTEGNSRIPQIFSVHTHAFQELLHHFARQLLLEIFHGLQPVLTPDPGLYRSPCRLFCRFCDRIGCQPVGQLPAEAFGISSVTGQGICLSQTDPETMPVELIDKFRIPVRQILPVDLIGKYHRFCRRLHIPGQIKDKPLL